MVADGRGLPELRLDPASIAGKTPSEAFPAAMAEALIPHYRAALAGEHATFDLPLGGRTYQAQVLPVPSAGEPTGMAVMQDATDRRDLEGLAELDRAKTAFFSNVSHEFRTPLTLMLGPLEERWPTPPERLPPSSASALEVAHRNGLRLLKLVNTLLDFSRIEAGRVEAAFEPTDLAGFTAELASTFRSAVERAGLRLVIDCPPLPEPVYVDRDMWEKIVLNLLSNAFKFTFAGRDRRCRSPPSERRAVLAVARHRHRHRRPRSCRTCSSASTGCAGPAAPHPGGHRHRAGAGAGAGRACTAASVGVEQRARAGQHVHRRDPARHARTCRPTGSAPRPAPTRRVERADVRRGGLALAAPASRRCPAPTASRARAASSRRRTRGRPGDRAWPACWWSTTTPTCGRTSPGC